MNQSKTEQQEGFSAVELLITLFIAAIFLFAGYQLYTQVLKDGANAQKTAQISALTYEKMRAIADEVTSSYSTGCSSASETAPAGYNQSASPLPSGFTSVQYNIFIDCPYSNTGALTDLFYIRITTTYNDGISPKVLQHATYAS